MSPGKVRRNDLDWIRVTAFGLLILFHVSLVYGPQDWHIRSVHTFGWVQEAILATTPWRLTILFLVSGAALRLMSEGRTAPQLGLARLGRLGPPLLFGVVLLVPVQSWIEAMDKGWWDGSLAGWWAREFSLGGLADGVPVNHLWFLVYACAYTMITIPLMADRARMKRMEDGFARLLGGRRILWVPLVYLAAIRILLFPWFGVTNNLTWDWYNHALSYVAFLFGYLLVGRDEIWRDLERYRKFALAIACVALPIAMIQSVHPGGLAFFGVPRRLVFAIYQWTVIAAILGYCSLHLRNAGGPVLTYLNQAVFPCYLAHQTILVLAVWLIKPANLPAPVEALTLIAATLGGSLLIYEAVRRLPGVRTLWGLRSPAPPPRYVRRRLLLGFGVAAPVVALFSVALALASHPGFDNATQYLSELGGASSTAPQYFNAGVLAAGVMAGLAGLGFGLALAALSGARIVGSLTAIAFGLAGAGLVISALNPWPDPRHMAINFGLGIQVAPLLLLWGLHPRRDLPGLKLFLLLIFVAMVVLTGFTKHLVFPGVVNDANVGWWERAYAVVLVGWVAVAAIVLERRLQLEGSAAKSA